MVVAQLQEYTWRATFFLQKIWRMTLHSSFPRHTGFDVQLCMLELTISSEHHLHLRRWGGSLYDARDNCYAVDLQFFGATFKGPQSTADLDSTHALVFNFCIATHKLRAFYHCSRSPARADPLQLLVHTPGWIPQQIQLKEHGTIRSLDVVYPINPGDSTSLSPIKHKLLTSIRGISIKEASARPVHMVIT